MKSRLPPWIARELPNGNPLVLACLNLMLWRRMRHVTAGWGLRRGLWVHGVKSPLAYLRLTQDYSLNGVAGHIRCPTLICSAEDDDNRLHGRQTLRRPHLREGPTPLPGQGWRR